MKLDQYKLRCVAVARKLRRGYIYKPSAGFAISTFDWIDKYIMGLEEPMDKNSEKSATQVAVATTL